MLIFKGFWVICLILLLLFGGEAKAGELAEKLANFPHWEKITSQKPTSGDLIYPKWMAGEWKVKSTLIDLVAPLAPDITTPGFEDNRQYLNQPVTFSVRFIKQMSRSKTISSIDDKLPIIADRSFNGLNLARAYLGDRAVISVKTDPNSPNRQITLLRGDRQLVSVITGRATETTSEGEFITTEVFQQLFKGTRPYFNSVESTTAYHQLSTNSPNIEADQVTAVYLSPQDPNYFKAGTRPVALYRYRLEFY